jgi:hypothetical protein
MMKKANRFARPAAWMTLGAAMMAIWILGPRLATNRALDAGYSAAGWVSSRV